MKSYRDLWLWLGAAWLTASAGLLAIALAYFTKVEKYSLLTSGWMLAAATAFVLAFACFYGAIKGRPFPPWDKIGFPDIKVDIYGAVDSIIQRQVMQGVSYPAKIWLYKVRITNLEKEQNANLIIRPHFALVPGSSGLVAETQATHVEWAIDSYLSINPLPHTITLAPGFATSGDLVYEVSQIDAANIAQPRSVRLVIQDLTSGKIMEKVLEGDVGRFTREDMRPGTLGVRFFVEDKDGGASDPPEADPSGAIPTQPSSGSVVVRVSNGREGRLACRVPYARSTCR